MQFFFNYFRQRVANIRALGSIDAPTVEGYPGSMLGEQLILATSGIDTLASHWARVWQVSGPRGSLPHAERMARFLAMHGDAEIWNRVAIPHVFRDSSTVAAAISERVRRLPRALTERGRRRDFRDDYLWDELRQQLDPLTSAEEECLRKHMYSTLLYKNYRNAWVHAGGGPGTSKSIWHERSEDEPYYDNLAVETRTKRVLVFPIGLLVRTYERAIESFHRACVAESKNPVVGLDSE